MELILLSNAAANLAPPVGRAKVEAAGAWLNVIGHMTPKQMRQYFAYAEQASTTTFAPNAYAVQAEWNKRAEYRNNQAILHRQMRLGSREGVDAWIARFPEDRPGDYDDWKDTLPSEENVRRRALH